MPVTGRSYDPAAALADSVNQASIERSKRSLEEGVRGRPEPPELSVELLDDPWIVAPDHPESLVGYGLVFYLLSMALEELPADVVYGTWAAMGIARVAVIETVAAIGTVAFDEPLDLAGLVGLALIVCGVYCVNVVSDTSAN